MVFGDGEGGGDPINILLVEPSPGDTRLFTEEFKDAKIMNTVHAVPDGESALDFLYQRCEYTDRDLPDVILLDPQLPGLSGADVLTVLKDESAQNPTIVTACRKINIRGNFITVDCVFLVNMRLRTHTGGPPG